MECAPMLQVFAHLADTLIARRREQLGLGDIGPERGALMASSPTSPHDEGEPPEFSSSATRHLVVGSVGRSRFCRRSFHGRARRIAVSFEARLRHRWHSARAQFSLEPLGSFGFDRGPFGQPIFSDQADLRLFRRVEFLGSALDQSNPADCGDAGFASRLSPLPGNVGLGRTEDPLLDRLTGSLRAIPRDQFLVELGTLLPDLVAKCGLLPVQLGPQRRQHRLHTRHGRPSAQRCPTLAVYSSRVGQYVHALHSPEELERYERKHRLIVPGAGQSRARAVEAHAYAQSWLARGCGRGRASGGASGGPRVNIGGRASLGVGAGVRLLRRCRLTPSVSALTRSNRRSGARQCLARCRSGHGFGRSAVLRRGRAPAGSRSSPGARGRRGRRARRRRWRWRRRSAGGCGRPP